MNTINNALLAASESTGFSIDKVNFLTCPQSMKKGINFQIKNFLSQGGRCVNANVERGSTLTFTRDLPHIALFYATTGEIQLYNNLPSISC